jgi:hypothetical protein
MEETIEFGATLLIPILQPNGPSLYLASYSSVVHYLIRASKINGQNTHLHATKHNGTHNRRYPSLHPTHLDPAKLDRINNFRHACAIS